MGTNSSLPVLICEHNLTQNKVKKSNESHISIFSTNCTMYHYIENIILSCHREHLPQRGKEDQRDLAHRDRYTRKTCTHPHTTLTHVEILNKKEGTSVSCMT